MYHIVEARIREALAAFLAGRGVTGVNIATQRPPNVAMGEVATPVAFELAKRLRRAPRQIAQEIATELAGNSRRGAHGDRRRRLRKFLPRPRQRISPPAMAGAGQPPAAAAPDAPKSVVEHTNINPNKAAHIGHLRNAALGDTLVRLLRRAGRRVEVQNYIDNTGVQVADVVVGFQHIEKKSLDEVRALADAPRFDYLCWDLYARVTHFYEEDKTRLALRGETLAGHRRRPRRRQRNWPRSSP